MIQEWDDLGNIYNESNFSAVPIAHFISDSVLRIYASSRNNKNESFPISIDYCLRRKVIIEEREVNLSLGSSGFFDENGIMPTSLLDKGNNEIWMYYIGWNRAFSVPFRNSIGLSISYDSGLSFEKYSQGPIMDRSIYDKCFVASNSVIYDDDIYRMYYLSCNKWEKRGSDFRHFYNIKYAESDDGIMWRPNGHICIDFKYQNEYAISTPRVIKENDSYKMWYSYRGGPYSESYRIGYAESNDGYTWQRKDELVKINVPKADWNSEMLCYPFIFSYLDNHYMLYNGNGYGESGIGLLKLKS